MPTLISSLFLLLMVCQFTLAGSTDQHESDHHKIVIANKRIYLPEYPGAHNPSIIEYSDGYILTFRYLPSKYLEPWISQIGYVVLDSDFERVPVSGLFDTRVYTHDTPPQSEDARIVTFRDRTFIIYNDNDEYIQPYTWERRDMYLTEVYSDGEILFLGEPLKLVHENRQMHRDTPWQKNWSPFECNGELYIIYSIEPFEVLHPNLRTGVCKVVSKTSGADVDWKFGPLRGGTPALLVDGEYLAFFHSVEYMESLSTDHFELWHYFMGAYTFTTEPPFALTSISKAPIDSPEFYTFSTYNKRVIYPGGYIIKGSKIFVAYGKDDCELNIATLDINALRRNMVPVTYSEFLPESGTEGLMETKY